MVTHIVQYNDETVLHHNSQMKASHFHMASTLFHKSTDQL